MFVPPIIRNSKVILALLAVSLALVIVTIVLILEIIPHAIDSEVTKNVQLRKGNLPTDLFLELPFPLHYKIYLFNVENPEDVLKGQKPTVRQIGPYVYKEYRKKTIKSIDDEEDTISYTQEKKFIFDPDLSGNLKEDDTITMYNMPLMALLQEGEKRGQVTLLNPCISDIFPNPFNSIFINVQVKDILFDGITFCVKHWSLCEIQRTIACKKAETLKSIDKSEDGSLRFSFFNYKARSDDGLYTVKRGIQKIQDLGEIIRWNNLTYSSFWNRTGPNSECDKIKGNDATIYHPKISKSDIFYTYQTDACRVFKLEFLEEQEYKNIKGYFFTLVDSTFQSNETDKEKDCFCAYETKGPTGEDYCYLDGVLDAQPCLGAPALLSYPHFLGADKIYINGVNGMSPNRSLHRSFILVEPNTGIPLKGAIRMQINAVLRPIKHVKDLQNVQHVIIPVLWIEEESSLTDEYVNKLDEMYFKKVLIVTIAQWTLLAVSISMSIILLVCYSRLRCVSKKGKF